MNVTESKKLLKHLVKSLPVSQEVSLDYNNETLVFFNHLITLPKYCNHDNARGFIVKTISGYAGKRYKGICLITGNSGYHMAITQASLSKKVKSAVKPNKRAKVMAALRLAIEEQIKDFRNKEKAKHLKSNSLPKCPETGKLLMSCKTHVDHIVPFIKLADNFIEENGLKSYSEISLKRNVLSPEWHRKWYDYHKQHATLQIVASKANTRAGAKGYESKFKT